MAIAGPTGLWYFSFFYLILVFQNSAEIGRHLLLIVSLMLYVGWGFLLNDIFDRSVDKQAGKGERERGHYFTTKQMAAIMLSVALLNLIVILTIWGDISSR